MYIKEEKMCGLFSILCGTQHSVVTNRWGNFCIKFDMPQILFIVEKWVSLNTGLDSPLEYGTGT